MEMTVLGPGRGDLLPDLAKDQKIVELAKSAAKALEWADRITIHTQEDAEKVAHGIQASRDAVDQVKEREKYYSEPLKRALSLFGGIFARYYEPWRKVDQVLTAKITAWRAKERQKREDAFRAAQQAIPAAPLPKGKKAKDAQPPQDLTPSKPMQPSPNAAVTSKVVNLHFQKRWTYEVVDMAALSDQYKLTIVDDAKVKADISRGVRLIPGLRIYQAEAPRRTG